MCINRTYNYKNVNNNSSTSYLFSLFLWTSYSFDVSVAANDTEEYFKLDIAALTEGKIIGLSKPSFRTK